MSNTPNLALPLLAAAQAQKHVTMNEALLILDGIVNLAVIDRDLATPPASPAAGAAYIIAASPTGAWAGRTNQVARFRDGIWTYATPADGWLCWIDDEQILAVFNNVQWVAAQAFQNLAMLGINATADATNKLSISSSAILFNHAGTSHQVKINKNAAANSASILFQTGFSGRAEIGTLGDDKFRFKVSANGSSWVDAEVIDAATGNIGIGTATPATKLDVAGPIRCASYAKAALPSASTNGAGAIIYVTDDISGATIAFSDGTAWRRVHDRAVVA
jgi:hypothetical protein